MTALMHAVSSLHESYLTNISFYKNRSFSLDDESTGAVHHGRRRDEETRRTKKDVEKDSFLWTRDFRTLTSLFERIDARLWHSVSTSMHCSKLGTIKSILALFTFDDVERQQKGMAYSQATTFIIYWCGHGEPVIENWYFSEGGSLTCAELINLWTTANRNDRDALTIISDTCHSGAWIDELRAMQIPNLAYQAACHSDETAWMVDDRKVPRSLLMRRFFIELMKKQRPRKTSFTHGHALVNIQSTSVIMLKHAEKEEETQRRAAVRGALLFFTIDQHRQMGTNYYDAEPNGIVRHGKFLKVVKK